MGSVNKVILVGNLGRDPELKYTPNGTAVANFTVATNEVWKDKDGQKQEHTEWHKIVVFGKMAETAGQFLAKGRQVYIEGSIRSRTYKDKEGADKSVFEIKADSLVLLGKGGEGGGQRPSPHEMPQRSQPPAGEPNDFSGDDEIPF